MSAPLVSSCPSCQSPLRVTRLGCTRCSLQLEGEFPLPALLRLKRDDLAFVVNFVLASGSLKEVARQRGQSYPTIRARLNSIIEQLEQADGKDVEALQHEILDAIASGKISAAEGARRLQEIRR